ncbi:MAG TPA: PP2C family protein-serine/threonine phosphatase, partial [Thermoanaerobaculia bacterium]|nr:PP2C family protein-serine/threonine phosphatase [Thermoanaerobaculia bacterium]
MSTMPAGGLTQLPLFSRPAARRHTTFDVAAVSRAARGFTGDFYRTHRYGDRLWFAIGDVAGKGLPAAVVMAMIQEELEHRLAACAITRCDPAATMERLHAYLRPLLPRNRFATAVIGHLQDNGTLMLASAGHCPPLIVRADRSVELLSPTGPVIGLLQDAGWTSTTTRLEGGDALVLY